MELAYAALARSAEVNADGSLSVLGLDFEAIYTPDLPHDFGMAVIAKIDEHDESAEFPSIGWTDLDIIGPNNVSILENPLVKSEMKLQKGMIKRKKKTRVIRILIVLGGIKAQLAGDHEVRFGLTLLNKNNESLTYTKNMTFAVEKMQ